MELFLTSPKITNPLSKVLCKLKFCVCDDGTHPGDNLNYSYGCSSSVILIQLYPCETLFASEFGRLSSKMAAVLL